VILIYKRFGITEVKFFEKRETFGNEKQVSAIDRLNIGTNERCQSCNLCGESSQPNCGNGRLVGDIERCDVQSEARDLGEKRIEVTAETCEVEGCEVGEPFEEAMKERACWNTDSERESKTVGDREKLF
jgi:hypothetical protein